MRPAPTEVKELGVPSGLVTDLTLRRALFDGHTSTLHLAEHLAVKPQLMDQVLDELRELRYIDVEGREGLGQRLVLSDLGHAQAAERLALCRYAGPIPVSLAEYTEVVEDQRPHAEIDHPRMRTAVDDLVVADELVDRLGPALRARGAMFLYGPSGTGKTSIAQRLVRAFEDDAILVPHAVEVDSQIVTVFDPVVHRAVDPQPEGLDPRWVACLRPSILAGGELTANELSLQYETTTGIHLAPLQMQANGGLLIIDDFGRQTMTPEQLLNRWIVPLDRGVDYLTLADGLTFPVPCTPKIVFSTNLELVELGDEAFFRRMRSKVLVPPIDDEAFEEVLRRDAERYGVEVATGAVEVLKAIAREEGDGDLRPYLPSAVCELVESICDYDGTPRVLDVAMVERAMDLFVTRGRHRGEIRAEVGQDRI